MNEPGKDLERLGFDVQALAGTELLVAGPLVPAEFRLRDQPRELSSAAYRRLEVLSRHELQTAPSRVVSMPWMDYQRQPGLIVTHRYYGGDAHGVAQSIRRLDSAFRRASAVIERAAEGERLNGWPSPIRPERGSLQLIRASEGSFDAIWTFGRDLAAIAVSTPVSLASLASLAWDAFSLARFTGRRWALRRPTQLQLETRPEAAEPSGEVLADNWSAETTKALAPVMRSAVDNGHALDFYQNSSTGELLFRVYPRDGEG